MWICRSLLRIPPSSTGSNRGMHFRWSPCRQWPPWSSRVGMPDITRLKVGAKISVAQCRRGSLREAASISQSWVLGLRQGTCTWCWTWDWISSTSNIHVPEMLFADGSDFRFEEIQFLCLSGLSCGRLSFPTKTSLVKCQWLHPKCIPL